MTKIIATMVLGFLGLASAADVRPNLLWITAEDICPNLGCYGDPDASTPNLDRFATEALRYTRTFSVHPCCSPSRSCLVTGVYPTRLGTFQHRGKMWVAPELIKCFPTLLRQAGYYTFNGCQGGAAKLDYNFEPKDTPWDNIGSKQVEWRNRKSGQPFFGQVNLFRTHQSQYGLRKVGAKDSQPAPFVHDPAKIHLPAYMPDTPAAREIWAEYHDRISEMDAHFGALLKRLDDDGLAEDTIVFFFGDNGHGVPSGKVWLWDQGPHVPLMVRIPKKWVHLATGKPGTVTDRLVSFLDFAPTALTLAGVNTPAWMQGSPFLGTQPGPARQYVHAARDFHDSADFDTSRMVRDSRFHYIRNFMPQQGWDAILYSWEQAPYYLEQWRQLALAGQLKADTRAACFFRRTKPVEELYDMEKDPSQFQNLAGTPDHQKDLERMRGECERWMVENRDLGLLSQYELYVRSEKDSPLQMGMDATRNPIKRLLVAANTANRRNPETIPQLLELLKDNDAAMRRWGAIGLLTLRDQAKTVIPQLNDALKDTSPDVRMTVAEALFGMGQGASTLPVLTALLSHESQIIRNETLLTFCRIGEPAEAALVDLVKAQGPGLHTNIWSYDNVRAAITLARSCIATPSALKTVEVPPGKKHPLPANVWHRAAREKPLP